MPSLPTQLDPVELADWLELAALEAGDKNSSAADLSRAMDLLGKHKSEEKAIQAIYEIEKRINAAQDAYPFELKHGRLLSAKANWRDCIAYIFCLCLSAIGWKATKGAVINPWLLFEDLALVAAEQYIQGKALKFGSRGKSTRAEFRAAIDDLCAQLGEGIGFKGKKTFNSQDDTVDIVVWREMSDGLPGKIILFGQCAAGENWRGKRMEMWPDIFWRQWMIEAEVSPLIRSFYMPHRVETTDREEWNLHVRKAGILFDRCRVAYWAYQANTKVMADNRYIDWCKTKLVGL